MNQSMYSRVAKVVWSRSRHGPRLRISSVLYRPMVVSARALSKLSPLLPTDATIWLSAKWLVHHSDRGGQPRFKGSSQHFVMKEVCDECCEASAVESAA